MEKISPPLKLPEDSVVHYYDPNDTFLYFESFAPFLDIEESLKLIKEHFEILADYTYCDIAVAGFLPIVIDWNLAKRIYITGDEYKWNWSELLLKNTQTLNLNIYYVDNDYRKYRLRFDLFNERYQKICKNLYNFNNKFKYSDLEECFIYQWKLLRIAPSFIEVEITTQMNVHPLIYPYKENYVMMNRDQFIKILDDLNEFGIRKSMHLSFAGAGDPLLHQDFGFFLEASIKSGLFEVIYIETFGDNLTEDKVKILEKYNDYLILIIKIPTLSESLYEELMGKNVLGQIKENLKKIPETLKVYAEILRIKQVEEELDLFFDFFKNTSIQPIIGKYNSYGDLLPDFRAIDLEPFEKDYCRNLMFSLFITSDFRVPICRQDIACKFSNFFLKEYTIKQIYENLYKYHINFINKKYDEIIPICSVCKDWYVFLG